MGQEKSQSQIARNRHRAIIAEYDRLVAAEKLINPVRAGFLPKQYYVHLISCNPELGLSKNYILKILNSRYAI